MTDSIHTIVKTIEKTSDNGIELINKVDSFYNSAWDKLIIIGSVAFGVIGIVVPYIIQWYQKKTLKISEELLKKEIENQTLKMKSEILIDINNSLEKQMKQFEVKMGRHSASANAKAFHLQGVTMIKEGKYLRAISDFISASNDYLYCEDYPNLQRALSNISNRCIPNLSQEEITDLKISEDVDLKELLNELTRKDEKHVFSEIIREIRLKLTKIPKIKLK